MQRRRPACRSPFPVRILPLILALAVACFATGCANYQLGTGSAPGFRTLYIEPVANKTLLPQSQALLSTRLRETFARDGRVSLANSPSAADATLTIVINDYHREVAAGRADDTGLAKKFNVTLGAICTLRDNRTGQPIFENRPIAAVREIFTEIDQLRGVDSSGQLRPVHSRQLQAEYQTLPILAEALATKVAHAALDVW